MIVSSSIHSLLHVLNYPLGIDVTSLYEKREKKIGTAAMNKTQ
jgi:hypothetical protein